MKNTLFALTVSAIALAESCAAPVEITNEKKVETQELRVEAANPKWAFSGLELKSGDSVVITAAGRWTIIPDRGDWDAAGQNNDEKAGGQNMAPGKHIGSLLVRVGEGNDIREMERYPKPNESVKPMTVTASNGAVKIYFVANDSPAQANNSYISGVRVGGKYSHGHAGFDDNKGSLTVKLTITRVVPIVIENRR